VSDSNYFEQWLSNIAVALGNVPVSPEIVNALHARSSHPSELVHIHLEWVLPRLLYCNLLIYLYLLLVPARCVGTLLRRGAP
jgi:hypothetical protein